MIDPRDHSNDTIDDQPPTETGEDSERMSEEEIEYMRVRLVEEYKFNDQDLRRRVRVTPDLPVTLQAYAWRVIGLDMDIVIGGAVAVYDGSGLSVRTLSADELKNYEITSNIVGRDKDGNLEFTSAEAVAISLRIMVVDGESECNLILEPVSCRNSSCAYSSVRVSWLLPVGPGEYKCDYSYFTFDEEVPYAMIQTMGRHRVECLLDNLWHTTSDPKKRLTMGIVSTEYLCGKAKQLMESGYPVAAMLYMSCAHERLSLQAAFTGLSTARKALFMENCEALGMDCEHRGFYDVASYYYAKAAALGGPGSEDLAEKASRVLRDDNSPAQRETFAYLVAYFLRLSKRSPKAMIVFNGGAAAQINGGANFWAYDFHDLMRELEPGAGATMLVATSRGLVIMRINKIDKDSVRATFFSPKHLDKHASTEGCYDHVVSNDMPYACTVNFSLEEHYAYDDFEKARDEATRSMADGNELAPWERALLGVHADEHFAFVRGLAEDGLGCNGNALLSYFSAFYGIREAVKDGAIDDFDKEMVDEICFRIGFILSQINNYADALPYLEAVKNGEDRYKAQYIYSLVKAYDFRTPGFIKQCLDSEGVDEDFRQYLVRSQIEYNLATLRYDKAKKELAPLMTSLDKELRGFAYYKTDKIIMDQLSGC